MGQVDALKLAINPVSESTLAVVHRNKRKHTGDLTSPFLLYCLSLRHHLLTKLNLVPPGRSSVGRSRLRIMVSVE